MMTRDEHLQWCKDRALAYLPDTKSAITSFMSDATKSPLNIEWDHGAMAMLAMLGMQHMLSGDGREARRWIEGFN